MSTTTTSTSTAGGGAGAASVVAPSPGLVTRITAENERLVGENARLKQAERMHSKRNEAEEHKIRVSACGPLKGLSLSWWVHMVR